MKKVIIYKILAPSLENIPIVTISLSHDNEMTFIGNENIIANLKESGIPSRDGNRVLLPADGLEFMQELKYIFKTPYLSASDIIEE